MPHAWPPAYQIVVEYDIVGLAVVGAEIVVLTKGHPYLVTGSAPGNLTAAKIPDAQACVSAQSIVAFENGVIYASPDGLVMIDGRARLISTEVFDERSWAALQPHTSELLRGLVCRKHEHENVLVHPERWTGTIS